MKVKDQWGVLSWIVYSNAPDDVKQQWFDYKMYELGKFFCDCLVHRKQAFLQDYCNNEPYLKLTTFTHKVLWTRGFIISYEDLTEDEKQELRDEAMIYTQNNVELAAKCLHTLGSLFNLPHPEEISTATEIIK